MRITPLDLAELFRCEVQCGRRARNRDRRYADHGFDTTAVLHSYGFSGRAGLFGQAHAGNGYVAVDRDRISAGRPDRDIGAARQRTDPRLGVDRIHGRRNCAVNGVSTECTNFRGSVCRILRRCGDSDLTSLHSSSKRWPVAPLSYGSKMYDRTNAFAFVHQVERAVDVLERHRVRNEFVHLDLAIHVLFHHARQL